MMAESVNDVTTVQQNLLHNLDGAEVALNARRAWRASCSKA
jgi:chemosensory pili system protein ChpA (sensor histidine kinase/response regulator)